MTFPCGGFIVDIPFSATVPEALLTLRALQLGRWVDGSCGGIFAELFAVNPDEQSFLSYVLYQEISPGGHWRDFHYFAEADVFLVDFGGVPQLVLRCFLDCAIIALFIRAITTIRSAAIDRALMLGTTGCHLFIRSLGLVMLRTPWHVLDLLYVGLLISGSILRWVSFGTAISSPFDFSQTEHFPQMMDAVIDLQVTAGYIDAMTLVLGYARLLKYTWLFPSFAALATTVTKAAADLLGIAITFAVLFMGFTVSATIVYSSNLESFQTVDVAASTLLRAVVGDLDYRAMARSHAVFTPVFFAVFSLSIVLVALNIVIAVLTSAFEFACKSTLTNRATASTVAAIDTRCFFADDNVSLCQWIERSIPVMEIATLFRKLRRIGSSSSSKDLLSEPNPRSFYNALTVLLFDIHCGSREAAISALETLVLACARQCPEESSTPLPCVNEGSRQRPGPLLSSLLREAFANDLEINLLLLLWLPAATCGLSRQETFDALLESRSLWLDEVDTVAFARSSHDSAPLEHRRNADLVPMDGEEITPNDVLEGFQLGLSARERKLLSATCSNTDVQKVDVRDVLRRATGIEVDVVARRSILSGDWNAAFPHGEARNALILRCGEQRGVHSGSQSPFLAHYTAENRSRSYDRIAVIGHVAFLALFLYAVFAEHFSAEVLESAQLSNRFLNAPFFDGTSPTRNKFIDIGSVSQYYHWLNQVVASQDPWSIDVTGGRYAGAIKLRQLRGSLRTCESTPNNLGGPAALSNKSRCALSFNSAASYASFGTNGTNRTAAAFAFQSSQQLSGFGGVTTRFAGLIPSDGFGLMLATDNLAMTNAVLTDLQSDHWIDFDTRHLVVELLTYSPSSDAFVHVTFVTTVTTGGNWVNEVVSLPFAVRRSEPSALIAVVIFGLMVLRFIQAVFEDFTESYLRSCQRNPTRSRLVLLLTEITASYWWFVDIIRVGLFIVTWTLRFYLIVVSQGDLAPAPGPRYFSDTEAIAKVTLVLTQLDAVSLLLAFAKLMYFVRSDAEISIFFSTLKRSFSSLVALAVATTLLLIAFGLTAFCWFGEIGDGFSTLRDALASLLLKTTLGDSGFEDPLRAQASTSYTIFAVVFVLSVKIVLLNVFIAVLTKGFGEARQAIINPRQIRAIARAEKGEARVSRNWLCRSFVARECVAAFRWLSRLCSASQGDPWRLRNPRLLWERMDELVTAIDNGPKPERASAARELNDLVRQCFFVDKETENRKLHGYPVRKLRDHFRKLLGQLGDEVERFVVDVPAELLEDPHEEHLLSAATSHHSWSQEQRWANPSREHDEVVEESAQDVEAIEMRVSMFAQ